MLESIFTFLKKFLSSLFTFLKILIRSNLFIAKVAPVEYKSCIILGNGPSLKNVLSEHLSSLSSQILWTVNKFPATEYYTVLKPAYFLFVASGYYKSESIKHEQDTRDEIIDALITKTTWNIIVFCPNESKRYPSFISRLNSNKFIKIVFFNKTPVEGLEIFNNFFYRFAWGMPRPHNVLIPAIIQAINMGYKEINVVGADHSWLPLISVNYKNEALINQQHFYQDKEGSNGKMYRNSVPRRLHEILEKLMLSFRSYFELENYAKSRGINIYNCTPNSFIDSFERKDLKSVFSEKRQIIESYLQK